MTLTSPSTDQPDTPAPKGAHVLVISGSVSLYKEVTIAVAVDTRIQIVHVKSQLNGVTMFRRELPDVVILDVDGTDNQDWLVTVSRIRKIDRHAMIVMMSSKSIGHNASIYTDGLARGATDFLTVPASGDDAATKKAFRWKLNALVHALTIARRQVGPAPKREATRSPDRSAKLAYDTASITLRPRSLLKPTALAIASSTGGPRALLAVIAALPRDLGIPIFITQHMPSGFTTSLAKSISSKTNWECQEGVEGA
ncbi:MAG: hypothetical protein HN893_03250 [Rhodospirillales bacterium]|nr:hypothetical protein [Rhodospirillales bacterium]